jgi:hypothetical protein
MNYRPGIPVVRTRQQIVLPNKTIVKQTVSAPMRKLVRSEQVILPPKPQPKHTQAQPHFTKPIQRTQVSQPRQLRLQPVEKRQKEAIHKTRDITNDDLKKISAVRNSKHGKTLVIVGNGPSISEVRLQDLRTHSDVETLMINKPDDRIWPTDHWAFFDLSQLRRHESYFDAYQGTIFNSTSIKRQKSNSMQIKNLGGRGFSRDLMKGIHIGRSSVYAAMQIALWMGYDKIFIFGCDMNPDGVNGKLHFYGTNPDVDPAVRKERFAAEATYYSEAADKMSKEDRDRFYFCSSYNKWDFVNKYKCLDHKEAVQFILKG